MNMCNKCVNVRHSSNGSYCNVERELAEIHGTADLGFPIVGDNCPHWEIQKDDEDMETG